MEQGGGGGGGASGGGGLVEEVVWWWWELTSWVGVRGIDFDIMPGAAIRCSDK